MVTTPFAWGLRSLHDFDPPYNCFPPLHVAYSFLAGLTAYRVHRGLGIVATLCATVIATSTLFTKQHYVVDVLVGVLMAGVASAVCLRNRPRDLWRRQDIERAPVSGSRPARREASPPMA